MNTILALVLVAPFALAVLFYVAWSLWARVSTWNETRRLERERLKRVRQICKYAGVETFDVDTYETIAARYQASIVNARRPTGRPVGMTEEDYQHEIHVREVESARKSERGS